MDYRKRIADHELERRLTAMGGRMRTSSSITILRLSFAGLMGTLLGCGSEPPPPDFTVEYLGDTMIIRDQNPKEWVAPRSLELDLLVGDGSSEGQLTFGRVSHMAVSPTGAIVVVDGMGNTVLRLRADGSVQDTIGGRGRARESIAFPLGLGSSRMVAFWFATKRSVLSSAMMRRVPSSRSGMGLQTYGTISESKSVAME